MPRSADVTITEPAFLIPLMVVQLCEASITTAAPLGLRDSIREVLKGLSKLSREDPVDFQGTGDIHMLDIVTDRIREVHQRYWKNL